MTTINEAYFDAAVRHQVGIRRFTAGQVRRVLELLEKADEDLSRKLEVRLAKLAGRPLDRTGARFMMLIRDIRAARAAAMLKLRQLTRGELMELSKIEADFESRMIQAAVPFELAMNSVSAETLRSIVIAKPFQGKLLGEWYKNLEAQDQLRLTQALRLGLAQGEDVPSMMRRIRGTRANDFTDGILSLTRNQAAAVVRTAVSHVSNGAREALWQANSDIIEALRWTSTLDGRTTMICISRDGDLAPIGGKDLPEGSSKLEPEGARPPAHVSCRSVMVAVLEGVGLVGTRPAVTKGTGKVDFRKLARQEGIGVREARARWAKEHVGSVPAKVTYPEWLKRQPAAFQDEVLGKSKGALFRRGGLTVDQFVDRRGNELTLDQLRRMEPDAFEKAGL